MPRLYQYVPPYLVPMLRGSDVKGPSRDRYWLDPSNPNTNFQLNYCQVKIKVKEMFLINS